MRFGYKTMGHFVSTKTCKNKQAFSYSVIHGIWVENGVKIVINELNSDYWRVCCIINVLGIYNTNTKQNKTYSLSKEP